MTSVRLLDCVNQVLFTFVKVASSVSTPTFDIITMTHLLSSFLGPTGPQPLGLQVFLRGPTLFSTFTVCSLSHFLSSSAFIMPGLLQIEFLGNPDTLLTIVVGVSPVPLRQWLLVRTL